MNKVILVVAVVLALGSVPGHAEKSGRTSTPSISSAGATQASINVQVCGGATGAPAGFSIQWMAAADFAANGNTWYASDDPRLCKASFSGNANLSRYDLAPGECVIVNVGALLFDNGASTSCTTALSCGTSYVFRAFAHATSELNRSEFTAELSSATLVCGSASGCTSPQDYWRLFNAISCASNPNSATCIAWPVSSITLGTVSYTPEQAVAILNRPAACNGLVALAHQLIAAKLNIANGADGSAISATIVAADALIGELVVPPAGEGFLDPGVTATYTAILSSYNEGAIGPGLCIPPDPGAD